MDRDLIGTETWDCDGCALTPAMRRDLLVAAAEMYESWEAGGTSWQWDRATGGLVQTEAGPVLTIGDFFDQLTGERHPFLRGDLLDYSDEFSDWLKEYLHETWEQSLECNGDDDGEEEDDPDPVGEAHCRASEWLRSMRVEDVLAWRSAQERPESGATTHRSEGF